MLFLTFDMVHFNINGGLYPNGHIFFEHSIPIILVNVELAVISKDKVGLQCAGAKDGGFING